MLNSMREDVVIVQFPYEMLLHGPIILNVTSGKLACNPHFQLFLGSSAYLTDDFMGSVLTKVSLMYSNCSRPISVPLVNYKKLSRLVKKS